MRTHTGDPKTLMTACGRKITKNIWYQEQTGWRYSVYCEVVGTREWVKPDMINCAKCLPLLKE